jgi:hypothetical protein
MRKIICILAAFVVISCNNDKKEPDDANVKTEDTSSGFVAVWPQEDQNEFMGDCVDNATNVLGEAAAFGYCKCMLAKVQQRFPTLDSAAVALLDTAQAAKLAQEWNCK